jgi:hypothetical protein
MKRFIIFCVCFLFSVPNVFSEDVRVLIKLLDGKTNTITVPLIQNGNVQFLKIGKETLPTNIQYLEVYHPYATAKTGEDGFYVFCTGMYGTFKERPNGLYRNTNTVMPMFGVKTPRGAMTVILTGMRYEAHHIVEIKDGIYTVFPRFMLEEVAPYEDIAVEFHLLDKNTATYSDMAKVYRNYQLARKICVPLKERTKNNPVLDYAAQSMEIRVRMGWKPVPSPIGEQTAENEPPMKTAITFDRFKQIVDEFKRQGINKAEFCLVGWNIGGHDGRYPQIFPPDERLGGELKLREAIEKAQTEGFQIVCHTNNSDAYHASCIGGLWDEGYLLRKKDGNLKTYCTWGGGNMYETCPKCMYERFIQSDFEKLKSFGFRGVHYIDVFSTVNPRTCYSPEHPLTKEDYATWTKKIFSDAQKVFGCLGSEGGFDYCISNLDYGLYISFYDPKKQLPPLIERHVPFWQLVYSGIVLNNPYTAAVNYTIKSSFIRLKLIEFGGRPIFYFYSKFLESGNNWMGDDDLTCATDEELIRSVAKIKEGYDEFEKLKALQFEMMESHDCISENVFKTTFSDGTSVISNYNNSNIDYNGQTVKTMGYIVIRGNQ